MELKPISVIQLQKISESVKAKYNLTKPTYSVQIAGGAKQVFEYDEASIADVNTPQPDKDKWTEYKLQYDAWQAEVNEKTTAYAFYTGIECEVSEEWLELQQWLGIELPDNKFDLKVRYITTELLRTPQDIKETLLRIMQLSVKGVDNSAIKAAESSFPSPL